jgi:hypothetical protein
MEIRHYKFDRITLNPKVCFGKPCIRGMRMPVASVLGYLSSGMTIKDILSRTRKHKTRLMLNDLGRTPEAFNRTTEQESRTAQREPEAFGRF